MSYSPKIEDYSFELVKKHQIGHPMQQLFEWEGFVTDKTSNTKYGTKFNFGQNSPSHDELFNSFLDKENFRKNWWIEIDIPKEDVKVNNDNESETKSESLSFEI